MKQYLILLSIIFPVLLSCSKEKGCTDIDAVNFNSEAEKADDSCNFLYLGLLSISLDSASGLVQMPGFNAADHKFILKFTADRYNGPEEFVLEFTNANQAFNYNHWPVQDVIITNEEWIVDIYLDNTNNLFRTFHHNIYEDYVGALFPVVGWGSVSSEFTFILGIRE